MRILGCQRTRNPRPTLILLIGSLCLACAGMARVTAEPAPGESPAQQVNSFEIPAYAFDRGNAKTFTRQWADGEPMVGFGGQSPVVVEYDVEFPVDGNYTVSIFYAAKEARPVDLYLDEEHLGTCCRRATGSWNTSKAAWEIASTLYIPPGKHTIKLQRSQAFPHVVKLRFEVSTPFPALWKLERPNARTLDSPPPVLAGVGHDPADVSPQALRRAIEDLAATFGPAYPLGPEYLKRLQILEAKPNREALGALAAEALLANPLLEFDRLLLVKRGNKSPALGLPRNWQSNCSLPKKGFDDAIAVLSPPGPEGELSVVYEPGNDVFVGDVDLHFDAHRMLFSTVGSNGRWQVCQIGTDGSGYRELTGEQPDVDSYDACYLPSGKIAFTSTACFIGVPCVYGSSHVATMYVMDPDGANVRQVCFDQEHDWCPVVMNDGRVLYSRWEYTDTPHANTRLLFHMNPDGTQQFEYYGSNSYWPNSFFYARPIPDHPSRVIAVIGGHHDNPRMGELVLFDPAEGRHEATGAVQRIPGYGKKVEMLISDGLTRDSWPKFLHPYPLSGKYFLVASKPAPQSSWGIYLVDVFDNMTLLHETPGYALLEPIPLRRTPTPPVVPERVDLARKDALVYLPDVYAGDGLKGIPRGTVKSLRIFTYHFAYQEMGGLLGVVGMDGPWDIKRVVGTVPVCEDGSAKFRVPANLPISLQPLDEDGKALQLMRSWMTAMPGEVVQCTGCHESQNTAPPSKTSMAAGGRPSEIQPWFGPMRGFSYPREVQPVVDRYCVGCHDGGAREDGLAIPNLRGDVKISDWAQVTPGKGGDRGGKFSVGYYELCRYVRRPGIESDYHLLEPMEFHADTTQLVQLLEKGHHGVSLDDEAWNRLITWIDLNCPYHGTWGEELADPGIQRQRRRELLKLYGGYDDDPEAVPEIALAPIEPIIPEPLPREPVDRVELPDWPFDAAEAQRRQHAAAAVTGRAIELADGVELSMTLIPAGRFVMGSTTGEADEGPPAVVSIERPFWMGSLEITNRQYALFDPAHDSRVETKNAYQFGIHGYPVNRPEQPVVRVTWQEAMAFCRWLSAATGEPFTLPSESQWEYACRAGSGTAMFYGQVDADFSPFANVSDATMTEFASDPYTVDTPLVAPPKYDDWIPKDARFNDGSLLSVAPGSYRANPWGLFDTHGNVAEWTRSTYRPYPNADAEITPGRKVVRGGSWRDRPKRCTSSFRLSFQPYQRVYNVGFRVICEAGPPRLGKTATARPALATAGSR